MNVYLTIIKLLHVGRQIAKAKLISLFWKFNLRKSKKIGNARRYENIKISAVISCICSVY